MPRGSKRDLRLGRNLARPRGTIDRDLATLEAWRARSCGGRCPRPWRMRDRHALAAEPDDIRAGCRARSWRRRRRPARRAARSSASPSLAVRALDGDRQHVHARRADEIADEGVLRPLEQLGRRADLHDLALVHDHDLVGEGQRLGLVVGDIDHGVAEAAVQLLQLRAQHPFHVRVDDRQRLVEQDRVDVGAHQPAAERDLLLLVGGQAASPCVPASRRDRSSRAISRTLRSTSASGTPRLRSGNARLS